ncbi:hypothetical protein NKH64_28165 [Mesorhizobium sp. M0999]|uniref:hypothetical protein n=1 Tax=Mesorhizobium sp. M0999 TaxID=2957045 RepID=UPI00333837C5
MWNPIWRSCGLCCLTAQALDALQLDVDLRCRPDAPRSLPGDVDLVLTCGPAALIGFQSEPFLDISGFPVASPALVAKGPDPASPGFYAAHRMIHDRGLYWWRRSRQPPVFQPLAPIYR